MTARTADMEIAPRPRLTALPVKKPASDASTRKSMHLSAPIFAIAMILLGALEKYVLGLPEYAQAIWLLGLIGAGFPVVWRTLRSAMAGKYATDVVASLSIVTAGIIGQPLAGLVIVLMQTGGEALEHFAERRASAAVSELEKAAPRIAHLITGDQGLIDVPVGEIEPGNVFLVRPGELIPCDGVVLSGISEIDASQLTGEAMPVPAQEGTRLMSGSLNAHGVLSVRASARAAESQYSRIVELVRSAQASKAPLQRLADRYAVWFTPADHHCMCGHVCAHTQLGSGSCGSGGCDALPAHSGHTGCNNWRNQSRGTTQDHHAPRLRARKPQQRAGCRLRQNGHSHRRKAKRQQP